MVVRYNGYLYVKMTRVLENEARVSRTVQFLHGQYGTLDPRILRVYTHKREKLSMCCNMGIDGSRLWFSQTSLSLHASLAL